MASTSLRFGFAALSLVSCLVGGTGCGLFQRSAPVMAEPAKVPQAKSEPAIAKPSPSAPKRQVGDFFVHRFSGSFAQDPLTLTEEVVALESEAWVVDFALSQGEQVERIRVRFDVATGQPASAAMLRGSEEVPATLADYEALLARTIYAADVNDGLVAETAQTCLVGADELDCETKTYKVWIGDDAATLSVAHSATYADRDVSGEITTESGKLIYRAELVEARPGKPAVSLGAGPQPRSGMASR